MKYLKLVRYTNLIIIASTMYLLRYCLMQPLLTVNKFELQLGNLNFFLLVIAIVLISAAGYVINDYYDVDADKFNKPDKVIVGNSVSLNSAFNLHLILNAIAIGLGIYLSKIININGIPVALAIVVGMLYFYSTTYKSYVIMGNLMVALFAGLLPWVVLLSEIPLLKIRYMVIMVGYKSDFSFLIYWFTAYSVFAFLLTLIREIIKDAEDFEGDSAFSKNTIPVTFGIPITKIVIVCLSVITMLSLLIICFKFLPDPITLFYLLGLVILPFILIIIYVVKAQEKKTYSMASMLAKGIMITGLLYTLIIQFIIKSNL